MIFSPDLVKQILAGKKTQTRRVVKYAPDGRELACRYVEGRVYEIQEGRGLPGVERLTVFAVRQERLGYISHKDAVREGFKGIEAFKAYWITIHGVWDPDLLVWVISFSKGNQLDQPRLLASKAGGHGLYDDYTNLSGRAMKGEGEAVPESVQERFSESGREIDQLRMNEKRQRLLDGIDDILQSATGRDRKRLRAARNQILASGSEQEAA